MPAETATPTRPSRAKPPARRRTAAAPAAVPVPKGISPRPVANAVGIDADAAAPPRPGVLRVALLDLNAGVPNQGMRCLRDILDDHDGRFGGVSILWDEFDVRENARMPDLGYDVYVSSGGPGSPFDDDGTDWGAAYHAWLDAFWAYNARPEVVSGEVPPKFGFFICYSFELLIKHFDLARLTPRVSESFGIFPVHKTDAGTRDPLLRGVDSPFYGADFRSWQAVEPDDDRLAAMNGAVLAIEKDRPHVALERAVMALRVGESVVATQFHPEADPDGMLLHFRREERKTAIIEKHGAEKYAEILHHMAHPDFLTRTYVAILPNFLRDATARVHRRPSDAAANGAKANGSATPPGSA